MADYMKKIDANKFRAIKILLNGGATTKEAAEFMQVSTATITYIRNSETYKEYKDMVAERSMRNRNAAKQTQAKPQESKPQEPAQVVKEVRQSVTIQATHYMMQELQKTNELLTLISRKLAFIVDELCGTKTEKDG